MSTSLTLIERGNKNRTQLNHLRKHVSSIIVYLMILHCCAHHCRCYNVVIILILVHIVVFIFILIVVATISGGGDVMVVWHHNNNIKINPFHSIYLNKTLCKRWFCPSTQLQCFLVYQLVGWLDGRSVGLSIGWQVNGR